MTETGHRPPSSGGESCGECQPESLEPRRGTVGRTPDWAQAAARRNSLSGAATFAAAGGVASSVIVCTKVARLNMPERRGRRLAGKCRTGPQPEGVDDAPRSRYRAYAAGDLF
jgi:hypothetical protein